MGGGGLHRASPHARKDESPHARGVQQQFAELLEHECPELKYLSRPRNDLSKTFVRANSDRRLYALVLKQVNSTEDRVTWGIPFFGRNAFSELADGAP